MFPDLPYPIYLVFGAAIFALLARVSWPKSWWSKIWWSKLSWPKVKLRTERQTCQRTQVTDVMLSVWSLGQRKAVAGTIEPAYECSVYIVWKKRKD